MSGKKATAKAAKKAPVKAARGTKPKGGAARKRSTAAKTISMREAEVEANLGGSQPLSDFLSKAGWS